MMKVPNVLLITEYFAPAKLAGGPVVSCDNLVQNLYNELDFAIFCKNKDMDKSSLEVDKDHWLDYQGKAKVLYAEKKWNIFGYFNVIAEIKPDIVYINGTYSVVGNIVPLIHAKINKKHPKIVIAPRGMLQQEALNRKKLKKSVYITFFKMLAKQINVQWHVTSLKEEEDLRNLFPGFEQIRISRIGNMPKHDIKYRQRKGNREKLRLLTIALVSPMKNILNIIKALAMCRGSIEYTLVGNIIDQTYWKKCIKAIDNLPGNITFNCLGAVGRDRVENIMSENDIYIQPSKSENFSHSIFEALMSGMPVITSKNTPWLLEEHNAGWNVNPNSITELKDAITQAGSLSYTDYGQKSKNARHIAELYMDTSSLSSKYLKLFNLN